MQMIVQVSEQRKALRRRLEHLQEPAIVTELLQRRDLSRALPVQIECVPQSVQPDRFVLRVEAVGVDGAHEVFAFKCYADNFGQRVMEVYQAVAAAWEGRLEPCPLCVPLVYVPAEHLLISRWVEGTAVWAGVKNGQIELLEHAATALAHLHQSGVIPEAPTTAQSIIDLALERCETLHERWPAATEIMGPLMDAARKALPYLDPAAPAVAHGDLTPDQFLWNSRHVTLLDMDMFGYTDPAYDVGYFLAQLHRWCLRHPALAARLPEVLETFRLAYLTAMPGVSPRNISFYYGLTLLRKLYTVRRQQPADWLCTVAVLAQDALIAIQAVKPSRTVFTR